MRINFSQTFGDFKCSHCHQYVPSDPFVSNVNNRNHCPYCLWSKHLDLYQPGDRLAACKGQMKPVGLTLKKTLNKYGSSNSGELMLVHVCTDCGKVSINRIAADDIAETIYEIYLQSCEKDSKMNNALAEKGIHLLEESAMRLVNIRLFGVNENRLIQQSIAGLDY